MDLREEKHQEIKECIKNPSVKVVSFDIFDTLLLRPVPNDAIKFGMLDLLFAEKTGAQSGFAKVRMAAESVLRRRIIRGTIIREDVMLSEIYQVVEAQFRISHDVAEVLRHAEEELELHLCEAREYGRELLSYALQCGKHVILVSDMYLDRAILEQMLAKNRITGWRTLYVSSEAGLRKSTGNLYQKVCEDLKNEGVLPEEILHIGDNQRDDVEMAQQAGMQAWWLPATRAVYEERLCAHQPESVARDLVDWEKACQEPGIAVFRQMAANRYFDDPFRTFCPDSAYNTDPWFIGYATLGPEVLGLVRWLADNCVRDGITQMLFLSRDGYLPMQVYEKYRQLHPQLAPASYVHVSRLALLPAMIRTPLDLFDLPTDPGYQTPEKLMRLLRFCRKCGQEGTPYAKEWLRRYSADQDFNRETFEQFLSDFIQYEYDPQTHEASLAGIQKYLKTVIPEMKTDFSSQEKSCSVSDKTEPAVEAVAVFDMGYSGRITTAMRQVLDSDFAVYFFHGDGSRQFHSESRSGISIRTFLDFNPYMEASLREYAYLEVAASCIGYDEKGVPLFDQGPADGYANTAEAMQKGALDFVEDFLRIFGSYETAVSFRGLSAAIPFEAFLRHCTEADKGIYDGVLIDDELWGGRRNIDLRKLMDARLRKLPTFTSDGK